MIEIEDPSEKHEKSAGMEVSEILLSVRMNRRKFPSKLWHLVNDPQICSICWDDSGEGILICQEAFEAEVLSTADKQMNKYFKTTGFISFVRQLNLYGFRKVHPDYETLLKKDGTIHHFCNPHFKRTNPELLVNLKRLTPSYKAKLAAGIEESNQSRRFDYLMLKSPENSTVVGTDLVEHQGTPHLYSQQVKGFETTPQTSQALVTGHDDTSSESCDLQMDFPGAPPSSPMQQGSHYAVPDGNLGAFIPNYLQCRFYKAGEYTCCIPGSLDSNTSCSQQEIDSFAHCGYFPDDSFSHLLYTGQDPNWQAGVAPDPKKSHMNLGTVFNVDDDAQVRFGRTLQDQNWQAGDAPDPRKSHTNLGTVFSVDDEAQDSLVSYLHCTDQDQNWQAGDAPDPRKSHLHLDTVFNMDDEVQDFLVGYLHCTDQDPNWQSAEGSDPRNSHMYLGTVIKTDDEMQVAAFITLPTNEKSRGNTDNY
ncbi:heat shock factor protein 5-like isoform X2 [Tachysurus fulvidraco]|uniref:heat shock factor protein 5-like isoform X2 n=1 Tax=Tachysurus fulvidraco TaxID=1234273 RepID=UPI001FEF6B08|nr:heat shock factor protein 5-like isoform X2 [Tachysurus fulvidraco]